MAETSTASKSDSRYDERLKSYDQAMTALRERSDWEMNLATMDSQRHCRDRSYRAVSPWPGASNHRYALADLMIQESKPDLCFLPFSTEHMATFGTLVPSLKDFCMGCEAYFDYIIKLPCTRFKKQYFYYVDSRQHYGLGFMEITWGDGYPLYEFIHPLMIIVPANAKSLEDSEWFVRVVQLSEAELRAQYPNVKNIDDFIDLVKIENKRRADAIDQNQEHDSASREQAEYEREGISRSGDEGRFVLWIKHFIKEGIRYWTTISPDVLDFDFGADNEYPEGYGKRWMVLCGPREMFEEKVLSPRGLTQMVAEAEHSMSKTWQAQLNYQAIVGNPILTPLPNSEIPSTTQNISLFPGSVMPHPMQVLEFPQPPFSWMETKLEFQHYGERRAGRTSLQTGRPSDREKNKTATQTKREAFYEDKSVQMDAQILQMFLEEVFEVSWGLIVANTPESLMYSLDGQLSQLPKEALSNQYMISVKGSVDQVNKEFRIQRKLIMMQQGLALAQAGIMTPQAMLNIWKSLVHDLEPGSGNEFIPDLTGTAQDEEKAAMVDIMTLMNGGNIMPKPHEDHLKRAEMATKYQLTMDELGTPFTPQQAQVLSQYVTAHREMLKKTNPQAYEELTNDLNLIDIQRTRQRMAETLALDNAQKEAQLGGNGVPPAQAMAV